MEAQKSGSSSSRRARIKPRSLARHAMALFSLQTGPNPLGDRRSEGEGERGGHARIERMPRGVPVIVLRDKRAPKQGISHEDGWLETTFALRR